MECSIEHWQFVAMYTLGVGVLLGTLLGFGLGLAASQSEHLRRQKSVAP